jgi:hypothetical protein
MAASEVDERGEATEVNGAVKPLQKGATRHKRIEMYFMVEIELAIT